MTRGRLLHFSAGFIDLLRPKISTTATGGTIYAGLLGSLDPSLGGLSPIGTADEANGLILDGDYEADTYGFAFTSSAKSDENGSFSTNPTVTVAFSGSIMSPEQGVTLIFGNDQPTAFDITFMDGGDNVVQSKSVNPDGRVVNVTMNGSPWSKVTVEFTHTCVPETYVKLARLFPGRADLFEGSEIVSCDITRECNMGGLELPAGSLSAVIASDAPAGFAYRTLLLAYWGDAFIGHFYVDKVKKQGDGYYTVTAVDAIGVLADTPYAGTYMGSDTDVQDAADAITGSYYYETSVEQYVIENIRGAVAATNKRDALLAFGLGAAMYCAARYQKGSAPSYKFAAPITFDVVNTAETSTVRVITPERIYDDADTDETVAVTSLEIISHAFTASQYGSVVIGNNRYNDTETSNTYSVTASSGLPNVKRISDALTVITGKKDAINTDPSDVATIGRVVSDYLKHTKRLIISEAVGEETPADLADTIQAEIGGVTYKANVEKINYAFGARIMKTTYTAVVISVVTS